MERVQFQQEQMLTELKDLAEKGLFTEAEIKQIMKRRTLFETALVRRVAKKGDFLRYATYEMGLEALRRKRAARLNLPPGAPSVSDYALVRRQFHIFERALKKFKSDIGLWIQYIQVAKKEGARSLVGRITARAMKLHPTVPAFYILAASHELEHLSPSAARVLLQRGIRMNADSVEMWREYVKMELGFVEGLRRRWEVLGIKVDVKGKGKEVVEGGEDEGSADREGGVEQMEMEDIEEDSAEAARREIMQGAIVKTVIANAAKALPTADLFLSLHTLLGTYPSPAPLRASLLTYLHTLLQYTLPSDPRAVKLTATRYLTPDLDVHSPEFVDVMREANERLVGGVRDAWAEGGEKETEAERRREGMAEVYAQFVEEWFREDVDVNLKLYLLASLHGLIRKHTSKFSSTSQKPNAPLLATHITLSARLCVLDAPPPSLPNVLSLGKKYIQLPGVDASWKVWIAKLEAEKLVLDQSAGDVELEKSWRMAREKVKGEGVVDVWVWGLRYVGSDDERKAVLEELLSESIRIQDSPSFTEVHDALLERYTTVSHTLCTSDAQLLSLTRQIKRSFLPTARAWSHLFSLLSSSTSTRTSADTTAPPPSPVESIAEVYHHWKALDAVESSVTYARWLIHQTRAAEAVSVVRGVRTAAAKEEVERRWREVLADIDGKGEPAEEEEMAVDAEEA